MNKSPFNPLRWLNSVVLGIVLMILVALYIAIGSGMPEVREAFEMNEMQFFNAWPLKALMALLVVNLIVVTWMRIPFTPPRWGVWCVHAGIIVLVFGTALYYRHKVEGLTIIPVKRTVQHFYDAGERSLYLKVSGQPIAWVPMPDLPRFKSYPPNSAEAKKMAGSDLVGIDRAVFVDVAEKQYIERPLAQMLGVGDPVKIDVVGYYPYAQVSSDYTDDPEGDFSGVLLTARDPHDAGGHHAHDGHDHSGHDHAADASRQMWVVSKGESQTLLGDAEIEFRERSADEVNTLAAIAKSAGGAASHQIAVKIGGFQQNLPVDVGQSYPLGETGYTITVERFDPAWPMFGTGEIVKALTLHVKSAAPAPVQEFRRMILAGRDVQTDFKLDPNGPPMGTRQKEPLDRNLVLGYTFADASGLRPQQGRQKHTLIATETGRLFDFVAKGSGAIDVVDLGRGGDIQVLMGGSSLPLHVDLHPRLRMVQSVTEVPSAKRSTSEGQSGRPQVLVVKISAGEWSQQIPVAFSPWAMETASQWDGTPVHVPGAKAPLLMQLGNSWLQMPAKLTLERFDLVPYAGGVGASGMMRDFKSTLTVEDPVTGVKTTEVAHMNNPVYFAGGDWLFYQAAWDPNGQNWTVIGVGTRPAVRIMIIGCIMITVGVLYAFYVKPIVIRRMKARALAEAAAKKKRADEIPMGKPAAVVQQ